MGMGTAPAHGFVISLDNLRELCPKEVEWCESLLKTHEMGWGEYARMLAMEEETPKYLDETVTALLQAFAERTAIFLPKECTSEHLDLELCYYDEETGDRYDELDHVDGCFFLVSGMVKPTLPGEKFKEFVSEQQWTQYG
jgi:hypothetical protein